MIKSFLSLHFLWTSGIWCQIRFFYGVLRHLELCSNFKQNKWITFIVINDYDYTKSMITIWKDQGAQIYWGTCTRGSYQLYVHYLFQATWYLKYILDKSMFNINVGDYFLITSCVLFFANSLAKPLHFFFWFDLFIFCWWI